MSSPACPTWQPAQLCTWSLRASTPLCHRTGSRSVSRCCQMALAAKGMYYSTPALPQTKSVSLSCQWHSCVPCQTFMRFLRLCCCRAACCILWQQAGGHSQHSGGMRSPAQAIRSRACRCYACACSCTCGCPLVGCSKTMANHLTHPSGAAVQQAAPRRHSCACPCLYILRASSREGSLLHRCQAAFAVRRAPQAAQAPTCNAAKQPLGLSARPTDAHQLSRH